MMAGTLIISMLSGFAASLTALAMAQPFWVALLAYPITGMVTLLVAAVLVGLRGTGRSRPSHFMPALQVRPRH